MDDEKKKFDEKKILELMIGGPVVREMEKGIKYALEHPRPIAVSGVAVGFVFHATGHGGC